MTKGKIELTDLIGMIGSMASLDFSKRLDVEISEDPINVMAYGLNMLSEELEYNVVKKSMLEEINRNLEQFSFTVAHDIKSPLSSAYTLITLIEMELEGTENQTLKEYFTLLKQINERTRNMINGILEYSKTNFNDIVTKEIELTKICAEIADEHSLNENVTVTFQKSMPTVYHNEFALTQIINNLVSNAIKYNDKPLCEIDIRYADKNTFYEISVTDNGPGIDHKDKERIFDLFENLNNSVNDSHGIGLSIVKKLVNQANGNVWVDDTYTQGARFIFTIEKREHSFQNTLAI